MSSAGQSYSKDEIYQAIRNADAAGDTAAVQRLSGYLSTMDQGGSAPAAAAPVTPQYQGLARLPAMAGQALAQGTAEMAGIPGDLESLGTSGINALRGGVSPEEQAAQDKSRTFPTGGEIINKLGLQGNALVPSTPLERYGSAGIKALPTAAAMVASGGAAAPALASTVLPALAGQGAHDLAPDSTWAPVAAGVLTGLGVGGAGRQIGNYLNAKAVNQAANEAGAKLEDASAAFENAKDAKFLGANDNATNVQNIKTASKTDFAATRDSLNADKAATHAQADSTIQSIANRIGGGVATLQDAGTALQAHARDWINNVLPKRLDALWKPVDAAIPKDTPTSLFSFNNALKDINTSAGELEPLASLLKPGAPARLQKTFKDLTDNPAGIEGSPAKIGASSILDASGKPLEKQLSPTTDSKPFTWGEVQKLRSTLGDAMSNPQVIKEVGAQNLSRLYATLTADMKATAAEKGAGDLFDEANAGSTKLYAIGEGPMSRVVASGKPSADDHAPEAVAKSLLGKGKAGASDLATLRQEIPQGIDALANAHLLINPKGFASMAPESQAALVPDQTHSQSLLTMLDAKDKASAAASQGIKLAQQNHQANVEEAQRAASAGNFDNAVNLRNSSKALADARKAHAAALENQKNLPAWGLAHDGGASITGLLLGENIGPIIDHMALHNSGIGAGAGALVGALGPSVVRGGVNFLRPRSPADLLPPTVGGLAGANALYGQPQSSN